MCIDSCWIDFFIQVSENLDPEFVTPGPFTYGPQECVGRIVRKNFTDTLLLRFGPLHVEPSNWLVYVYRR